MEDKLVIFILFAIFFLKKKKLIFFASVNRRIQENIEY